MSSNVINLDEAMDLVRTTLELSRENNHSSPYFFIIGAGVSYPEIPVASTIIENCMKKVEERNKSNPTYFDNLVKESEKHKSKGMEYYSFWIEKAYPNKADRSNYFQTMIKKSKISAATMLLAQVLYSRDVTNTVFTTNFDENLEKALSLFGTEDLFIADNPRDNLVLEVESESIQIAHVHGSYRFYDCANLECEIQEVTNHSDVSSSAFALRKFLLSKAPIIVGYSGWDGDVIMNCIQERIQHTMPYKYIWVCFSKDDYERAPDWLKNSNSIQFVVPEHGERAFHTSGDPIFSITETESKIQHESIPATLFFGKLVANLSITPPTLLSNPALYFSEQIKKSLPDNEDVFYLKRWAERLGTRGANETLSEKNIQLLELASSKKDYISAIDLVNSFANDMTLSSSDYIYILQSIIMQLLDQEDIISEARIIIDLRMKVVSFLLSHKNDVQDSSQYSIVIGKLLDISSKFSANNIDGFILVAKDVLSLIKWGTGNDDLVLRAQRLIAAFGESDEVKLSYINEIISNTKEVENLSTYAKIIRCNMLLKRMKITSEYELAQKDFFEAQSLTEKMDNVSIKFEVLIAQIDLGCRNKNTRVKKRLQEQSVSKALSYDHYTWRSEILSVVDKFGDNIDETIEVSRSIKEGIYSFLDELYCESFEYGLDLVHYLGSLSTVIQFLSDPSEIIKNTDRVLSMEGLFLGKAHELYCFDKGLALSRALDKIDKSSEFTKVLHYTSKLKELADYDIRFKDLYLSVIAHLNDGPSREYLFSNGFEEDLMKVESDDKDGGAIATPN